MVQHGLESRLEAAEQQVARLKVTADDYLKQLQEANAARARLQQVGHLALTDQSLCRVVRRPLESWWRQPTFQRV